MNLIVQNITGDHTGHDAAHRHDGAQGTGRLTAREREVLGLVAAGISNKGIARELQASPNTVKFHIGAILAKIDAASRAEAVVAALRRGDLSL